MDGQFAINQDIRDDDQTDNLNQLSTVTISVSNGYYP